MISQPKKLGWTLMIVALGAYVTANVMNLWSTFLWYDKAMHAFTAFALTIFLGAYLYRTVLIGAQTHIFLLVLSLAGLGLAAGALWEVYEWIRDLMFPEETLVVGKVDTMIDLIFDALGALLGATVTAVFFRRHPQPRHLRAH